MAKTYRIGSNRSTGRGAERPLCRIFESHHVAGLVDLPLETRENPPSLTGSTG